MNENQPSKLLVVEDDKLNQMLIGQYLKKDGHIVTFASDGRQALNLLGNQQFDMVLLDIEMPEVNGYEVLQHIVSDPQLSDMPVIMTTALDQIDSVVQCIEMGAEDYLIKPVNQTLLKARIDASLEKKHLRDKQKATLKQLEQEMELARNTQMSLLPDALPAPRGFEFGAIMKAARSVGGDFYDVIPMKGNCCGLVIGDVADKGLPAALYMTLTYSLLRVELLTENSPAQALRNVNRYLLEMNPYGMFVTVLCGILDCGKDLFTYARAGHLAPILLTSSGEIQRSPVKPSQAIGLFEDLSIDEGQIHLSGHSSLILLSDGVSEPINENNEQFDETQLSRVLYDLHESGPQELCEKLWESVQKHTGQSPQQDDFTVLAVRHNN